MKARYRSPWVLAGLVLVNVAQAAPDLRPGLWEITMQLEMAGMPMAMPPITQQVCFTAQDMESGANIIPQDNTNHCRPEGISMNGSTATWSLQCDNMTGQGTLTYTGDSYRGSSDITTNMAGETQQIKQIFSGQRLGDCEK